MRPLILRPRTFAPFLLLLASIFAAGTPPGAVAQARMGTKELGQVLGKVAADLKGGKGRWEFRYQGVPMIALADEKHNRMRVVAFLEEADGLDRVRLLALLEANFDRTLDARYAIFRGFLVSIFLHPLGSLTSGDLESALGQVANLVRNYGGTYSSGVLRFGTGGR